MFKKSLNFPGLVLLALWLAVPCWGAKPLLYIPLTTGQHQLFLDDYLIGALYRAERRINPPTKYEGNPLISADKPWKNGPGPYWNTGTQKVLQIRSAPCWDPEEQVWKLWYFTAHKTAYARSLASGNTRAPRKTIWSSSRAIPRLSSSTSYWIRTPPGAPLQGSHRLQWPQTGGLGRWLRLHQIGRSTHTQPGRVPPHL